MCNCREWLRHGNSYEHLCQGGTQLPCSPPAREESQVTLDTEAKKKKKESCFLIHSASYGSGRPTSNCTCSTAA